MDVVKCNFSVCFWNVLFETHLFEEDTLDMNIFTYFFTKFLPVVDVDSNRLARYYKRKKGLTAG